MLVRGFAEPNFVQQHPSPKNKIVKNNHVQLIGYVGGSPKLGFAKNGDKYARLRVATHFKRKEYNEGKAGYGTVWHDVLAWEGGADHAERSFVTGSHILVSGSLRYRTFRDAKGHTRYVTEIKADCLINLDR
jgi:single-strand DNA-binding protein